MFDDKEEWRPNEIPEEVWSKDPYAILDTFPDDEVDPSFENFQANLKKSIDTNLDTILDHLSNKEDWCNIVFHD